MEKKLIFHLAIIFSAFLVLSSVSADSVLKGDVNKDTIVNSLDLKEIDLAFHSTPEDENWNSDADIDTSQKVDVFDLAVVGKEVDENDSEVISRTADFIVRLEGGSEFCYEEDPRYCLYGRVPLSSSGKTACGDVSGEKYYTYVNVKVYEVDPLGFDELLAEEPFYPYAYTSECDYAYFQDNPDDICAPFSKIDYLGELIGGGEGNTIELDAHSSSPTTVSQETILTDVYVYNQGECKCIDGRCCDLSSRPYNYKPSGAQPGDKNDYYFCSGTKIMKRDYFCLGNSAYAYDYKDVIDRDCGGDYCNPWSYYCKDNDLCRFRDCYDRGCSNAACYSDSERQREEPYRDCGESGYGGDNYCYDNNVYRDYINRGCSSNACYANTERILQQDCGSDYCNNWGGNYCKGNSLYHSRVCYDKECSYASCLSDEWIDEQKVQDCSTWGFCSSSSCISCSPGGTANCNQNPLDGCEVSLMTDNNNCGSCGNICSAGKICKDGQCSIACSKNSDCGTDGWINQPVCQDNDVYDNWRTYKCNNPGTPQASCSYSDELKSKQDCGEDYCDPFGGDYCKDEDVYKKKTCYDRGCSEGACFDKLRSTEERKVQECGIAGCSNGQCVAPPCTKDSDCSLGEFCQFNIGECGGHGICYEKPLTCPTVMDPVCGCDYKTYSNDCVASMQGVSIKSLGECSIKCHTNADCGEPKWIEEPFCYNDDVYQKRKSFLCYNQGTLSSYCMGFNSIFPHRLKEDCGDDYCNNWGGNYCKDDDVYHKRECYDEGCLDGSCFSNLNVEEELKEDCGAEGCSDGQCNIISCTQDSDCGTDGWIGDGICLSSDIYQAWRDYVCNSPGTYQASCSHVDTNMKKEDCGKDYCDAFGDNYCKNGDVYHARGCYEKGCLEGTCYEASYDDERVVETCDYGCENGQCLYFIVSIPKGVSLFSLPLAPSAPISFNQLNSDCDVVNNGIDSECTGANLAYLNPSTGDYQCLGLDDVLYPGQGYFIKVEDACSFSIAGKNLTAEDIGYFGTGIIKKGENLIGALTENVLFSDIKGSCYIREDPLVFVYGAEDCSGVDYYTGKAQYCKENYCYCTVSTLQPGLGYNLYSHNQCYLG